MAELLISSVNRVHGVVDSVVLERIPDADLCSVEAFGVDV